MIHRGVGASGYSFAPSFRSSSIVVRGFEIGSFLEQNCTIELKTALGRGSAVPDGLKTVLYVISRR
jgi:hypothetical protein